MGGLIFLHLMFLAMFSVSSTQISKPGIFKLEENKKSALLDTKNGANPGEEKEPDKRDLTQGKPGMLILQGKPGYSNKPGKPVSGYQRGRPEVLNKPGTPSAWILQGKPVEENQKGTLHTSNKQEESRSPSQQGKPESFSQKGKPASAKDKSKPEVKPTLPSNKDKPGNLESSNQQGKPGSSSQQRKPESSSPQRKPRSLYKQEGKSIDNLLKDDTMGIEAGSMVSNSPAGKKRCDAVYKPVCGSDGKTYGNPCIFKEAERCECLRKPKEVVRSLELDGDKGLFMPLRNFEPLTMDAENQILILWKKIKLS